MRSIALLCLGAALGAFLAVPAIHLIGHEDDHVHINGAVVPLEPEHADHEHADHEHEQSSPVDHGKGSLSHLGAATLEPPAALDPTPIVEVFELPIAHQLAASHRRLSRPRARAPPSL